MIKNNLSKDTKKTMFMIDEKITSYLLKRVILLTFVK